MGWGKMHCRRFSRLRREVLCNTGGDLGRSFYKTVMSRLDPGVVLLDPGVVLCQDLTPVLCYLTPVL